ncbi:MAG: protoheme IX farnesyltransferase [Deltaproteobacteria bacterium]|nr:protoheme IX farnesyltransferase [Deltaproteobacteria bacterium]
MFAYLNLTKPRISLLFALSGFAALLIERSMTATPLKLAAIVLAIFLVGGSANAFNQYFERDIDARMTRTSRKRPLPLAQVSPLQALLFSTVIGALGTGMLLFWGGWLAGLLGLCTILFYSLYYTLWLKPRTPYNIVIGGIAGATGPLIGWAAATGTLGLLPLIIFLIIFVWTPPHFWALALNCKEDYARVGYPMLPNVVGDNATYRQIMIYSVVLFPLTVGLSFFQNIGWLYGTAAVMLSTLFVALALRAATLKTVRTNWILFGYSIVYLLLLFVAMIVDVLVIS